MALVLREPNNTVLFEFSAPTDYFLYGNRSLSFYQLGKYDQALADAIRASEVKPDWAKAYFRKGAALQGLGRHEEAFQAFYECLTLEEEKATKQVIIPTKDIF